MVGRTGRIRTLMMAVCISSTFLVGQKAPNSTPANSVVKKAGREVKVRETLPTSNPVQASDPKHNCGRHGQCMPIQSLATIAPQETVKSFSELTFFLFASALALFVALLGWSDQIRGIDKDTKELETRFLKETGIEKRDFLCIVKPKIAGQQLSVLTRLLSSGKIQSHVKADLLTAFKGWYKQWSRLEELSAWKYNLTVTLTITLFVAGGISLFTRPDDYIRVYYLSVRSEMLVLIIPMLFVLALLIIIIYGSRLENSLRAILDSIADEV